MERFLLFDSQCSICTGLANEMEKESSGWLKAQSLRDRKMQDLLSQARPNWRFEPTLLEIGPSGLKVFTGFSMRVHLLQALGPRRSWRLYQILRHRGVSLIGTAFDRRRFLKQTGVMLGGFAVSILPMASGAAELGGSNSPRTVPLANSGELYAGFLLLPDGAPYPEEEIQDYYYGIPNMCGAMEPDATEDAQLDAIDTALTNPQELSNRLGVPVYLLGTSFNVEPTHINLIEHSSGAKWAGRITYDTHALQSSFSIPPQVPESASAYILAQVDFAKPFPLWFTSPVEPGGPSVSPEKVSPLTTGPGILIRTPIGFSFHWIEANTYFTLSVDHWPNVPSDLIINELVKIY